MESDRGEGERKRERQIERGWRGPELSLSEAGGECEKMIPRSHAASVHSVPGCSLSLSAGRAAAFTSNVSVISFFFLC